MAASYVVLIAASDVLPAFTARAAITDAEVLAFSDADVLRALEAITVRKPRLVALERLFAATPRGAALINRIKADPSLLQSEIRVLAHDSDYSRVLPRGNAPAAPSGSATAARPTTATPDVRPKAEAGTEDTAASEHAGGSQLQPDPPASTAPAAMLEPPPLLDQRGTRRAPRYAMAQKVEILVDGNPALLLDLSTIGAQVVSPTILRPNQRVRMSLPEGGGVIRFNATIAWAAFEIPPQTGPQYRAGIEFMDADAATVDAFCARHRA